MFLRLKFFYIQLEENAQVAKEFLVQEFPVSFVPAEPTPQRIKEKTYNPLTHQHLMRPKVSSNWRSPFGSEVDDLRKLTGVDLTMAFNGMRNRIAEYQKIYCLYSKCLSTSKRTKHNSDVL